MKRERQYSEKVQAKRYDYIFRERSIDDGSHFDPRLDKYPVKYKRDTGTNTLGKTGTLRSEKKLGGLEKVCTIYAPM